MSHQHGSAQGSVPDGIEGAQALNDELDELLGDATDEPDETILDLPNDWINLKVGGALVRASIGAGGELYVDSPQANIASLGLALPNDEPLHLVEATAVTYQGAPWTRCVVEVME